MNGDMNKSKTIGVAQALASYGWWGFVTAFYYHWLLGLDAFDLVSWRVVSAIPVVFILIVVTNSFDEFKEAILKWKNLRWLVVSALLILVNWLAFIWAVISENIIQASLGYYLNPLVSIALSALILKEKLRPTQWASVGIAGLGFLLLTSLVGLPWISITLGVTFPLYGLIRKQCPSSATVGLTVEMVLLLPLMTGVLIWMAMRGDSGIQTGSTLQIALIPLGGIVTVIPLLCFSAAARRLRLSTVGMLQYIAPTGQFLSAVFFFGESMDPIWWIAFACVWIAIILYSGDSLIKSRRQG
jgi:chloramphenicol-sensitive protein RarD